MQFVDYSLANIESIDSEAFTNNSSIKVIKYPSVLKTAGKWGLHGLSALERVYVPGTLESATSLKNNSTKKCVFFFTGDIDDTTKHTTLYTVMEDADVVEIEWDSSKSDEYYVELAQTNSKFYIVYNYNFCTAFYDAIHALEGTGNCIDGISCTRRCDYSKNDFTEHNIIEALVYENGFALSGKYTYECSNTDCTVIDVQSVTNPIFNAGAENGYSTNGRGGIAFGGYAIDLDALDAYNRINKDATLNFGVLVANPKYIGDTFMSAGQVNAQKGFVQVELDDTRYTNIQIMLDGFTGDASELELVISLYAYSDANKIEYIQSEHTVCASSKVVKNDATLYTVSLSSVKNKTATSIEALPEYGKKDEE